MKLEWLVFSPVPPPLTFSILSLSPLTFSPNTLEKVSSTDLTLRWGELDVELKDQDGLGGQVKEGGEEEEEEEQYALGRILAPSKVSFWMPGSQWGESIFPLIHHPPHQPWAGPRQRIYPNNPPTARPFSSRGWGWGWGNGILSDLHMGLMANPGHPAPSTRIVNRVGRIWGSRQPGRLGWMMPKGLGVGMKKLKPGKRRERVSWYPTRNESTFWNSNSASTEPSLSPSPLASTLASVWLF